MHITSAKEVMFSLCLFFVFSRISQKKTTQPNFHKDWWKVTHGPQKNPLDFGVNLEHVRLRLRLGSVTVDVSRRTRQDCVTIEDQVIIRNTGYIMGTDQPECSACHCRLTVKHILTECTVLTSTPNKHFTASSTKDRFYNVAAPKHYQFYQRIPFLLHYIMLLPYILY